MAVRRRATWSSNEYFAHKKNVGEEAKLRNTIITIEKNSNLTKDTLRHKFGEVRTSLKNLRKSTGHSIETLPPTPFQKYPRSPSLLPVRKEATIVANEQLPPELQYLENDIDIPIPSDPLYHDNPDSCVENINVRDTKSMTNTRYHSERNCQVSHRLTCEENDHDHNIDIKNHSRNNNKNCTHFPALIDVKLNIDVTSAGNSGQNYSSFDNNKNMNTPLDTKLPVLNSCNNITKIVHGNDYQDQLYGLENEKDEKFQINSSEQYLTEPIQLPTTSSNWNKKDEKENKVAPVSERPSADKKFGSKNLLQKRKGGNPKSRDNISSFRDIRNRCRTCLERFRQNAEFQKLRKEMEEKEAFQSIKEDKSMGKKFLSQNKSFMTSTLDLESVLSDEVLDFDDNDISRASFPNRFKKRNCIKKGYSRQRMDQLAEPRGGRKRRLFSKQLIKKEADILIESHSQPQMTDREKERLRMIESKIRMFLAMMQNSLIPSTMVDIPQREDIMKVDISHL